MRSILIEAETGLTISKRKLYTLLDSLLQKELGDREVELSVLVVGPRKMRQLNRDYRQKDKPTTVLEFSQIEKKAAGDHFVFPPNQRIYLGDLVLCPSQARKLARKEGVGFEAELERLLIHALDNLIKAAGLDKR